MNHAQQKFVRKWAGLQVGALVLGLGWAAHANPQLRYQIDQRGDFTLIGNTSGYDCSSTALPPLAGTVDAAACAAEKMGGTANDTAPDFFWKTDTLLPGTATATASTKPKDASSRALLGLPPGSTITYARLYWAASGKTTLSPLNQVTFSRPGGFSQAITADATRGVTKIEGVEASPGLVYQATADVTNLVKTNGLGLYQVTGIPSIELPKLDIQVTYVAWNLVVLYQNPNEPVRNLAVFDGLDKVEKGTDANVTITGFSVPAAGFDAKIGVISYEGDEQWTGDSLFFNGNKLSNEQNGADNFFNGTRSSLVWDSLLNKWKSVPVSILGDLPQMAGTAGSMHGFDMDIIDVTQYLSAGQTQASFKATSSQDVYLLGVFVTSVSTYKPVIDDMKKLYTNTTGAQESPPRTVNRPLDVIEYEITNIKNTGNDAAVDVKLEDMLPLNVTYQPGSLCMLQAVLPGCIPLTDAAGDDVGSYQGGKITVYLGAGATATQGGKIPVNGSVPGIRFKVKVNASTVGSVSNQAFITVTGEKGKTQSIPSITYGSGDGMTRNVPTVFDVTVCQKNSDCPEETPICDLSSEPHQCVKTCTNAEDCSSLPGGPYECVTHDDGKGYCETRADLSLTVVGSESMVDLTPERLGNRVEYILKPKNGGAAVAPGAQVIYTIPANTTVLNVDGGLAWQCEIQATQVVCTHMGSMLVGDATTIQLSVFVEIGGESVPFEARIVPLNITDPDLSNNTASLVTELKQLDLAGGGFGCSTANTIGSRGTLIELGVWLTIFGMCVVALAWRTARMQRARESA